MIDDSKFRAEVKSIFEKNNFNASLFDYKHLIHDKEMQKILENNFSENHVYHLFKYSPDLFIMHKKLDPEIGCFFVNCFQDISIVNQELVSGLKKHYPESGVYLVYPDNKEAGLLIISLRDFDNFDSKAIKLTSFFKDLEATG